MFLLCFCFAMCVLGGELYQAGVSQERHGGPDFLGSPFLWAAGSLEQFPMGPCSPGQLDGDTILDEGRVQVGVG